MVQKGDYVIYLGDNNFGQLAKVVDRVSTLLAVCFDHPFPSPVLPLTELARSTVCYTPLSLSLLVSPH